MIHAIRAWIGGYGSVACAGQNKSLSDIRKVGAIKRHDSVANGSR
jgi:hypothetical protein